MCDEKISASIGTIATRPSNLQWHLGHLHPEILKQVQEKYKASSGTQTASNTKTLSTRKKPATETLTKFFASDKVTMTMTPNALKNTVDITVFNGNSLRFFSQPEVLARIGELARRLRVSRNRNNIKKLVLQKYEIQKEQLNSKLSNKLVYLKMDACPCHCVNYFAINVRYVDEGKNYTETLAIRNTEAQHYSKFLTQW